MPRRMSRRTLLTSGGSALTAALLAACSTDQPGADLSVAPGQPGQTVVAPAEASAPEAFARQPYLHALTTTSVTVEWALAQPNASWLAVGPIGGALRRIDAPSGDMARVTFDALQPGERYEYQVGVGDRVLTPRTPFRSVPGPEAPGFSFVVFGDSGEGNRAQRTLAAQMDALAPDMAIHTGDFVYGKKGTFDNRYFQVYAPMLARTPVFPAIGDNDAEENGGAAFGEAFTLPGNGPGDGAVRAYAFDYGPAHFIALDTETDFGPGSVQYRWLEQDLAGNQQPWTFVFFHRPTYSAGLDRNHEDIRMAWCPLFERYGVAAVFSGHDHNYQRTAPIREFTSGDGGVVYIISGGGGADLRPVEKRSVTLVAESVNHVVTVEVSGTAATLRAILTDGSTLDEATIPPRRRDG